MKYMKLGGKVTVVTGATGGIGKSTSKKILEEGGKVVLVARNKDKLKKTVNELNNNGNDNNILAITADVSHESEILNAVEQALSVFDRIDILINCAAIINDPMPFHLMTEDQWNNLINVNLKGTFQPIKAIIPIMIQQNNGNIINISSSLGIRAIPKVPLSVYGITKS
ncbi:MAG: SDR family oxidoreductase, partial [Thermoproteota archaeon]|nr:SDR family oxidoreductase [Thermoproteota archaeon]